MPYSSQSGKKTIQRIMQRIKPATGLDIGCGSGTYAKLFPETMWHGVEVWEPYFEQFNLRELYWLGCEQADARTWDRSGNEYYDVAIAGDVLEHMTAEEAKALFEKLQKYHF